MMNAIFLPLGLLLSLVAAAPRAAIEPSNHNSPTVVCELPAPGGFTAERTSGATATLAWNAVSGAASYRLTIVDNASQAVVFNTVEYGTSKSLTGLTPGATYRCILAANCPDGGTSGFVVIIDILT